MRYFLTYQLPSNNWKSPHVSMVLDSSENSQHRQLPSSFVGKPISPDLEVVDFYLTGNRNKSWDLISPTSARYPRQALISKRFYKILQEFNLPEIYFSDVKIYDHKMAFPEQYKMVNITNFIEFSIVDFKRSKTRTKNSESNLDKAGLIENEEDFVRNRGKFVSLCFNHDEEPDFDLFVLRKISGWIISESLAERIKSEKLTGLFGFPLTADVNLEISYIYKDNKNYFRVTT